MESGEQITEINYICNCDHLDYTSQFNSLLSELECITNQNEYLTTVNQQILYAHTFSIGSICAIGVCFILYKFLKIFI